LFLILCAEFDVARMQTKFANVTRTTQEAIGTEAPGQVDCLYWVSAIQSADEISPA
jgi:hypothetical protein